MLRNSKKSKVKNVRNRQLVISTISVQLLVMVKVRDLPSNVCLIGRRHAEYIDFLMGSRRFHKRSGKLEYRNGLSALLIGITINPIGRYESVGIFTPSK